MPDSKKIAIQIAEDLKGIDNQDNVVHNVEQVSEYVLDSLQEAIGSKSEMWTDSQKELVFRWREIKKQAKRIYENSNPVH